MSLAPSHQEAVHPLGDTMISFPLGSRSFIPSSLLAEIKRGTSAVSGKMSVQCPHLLAEFLGITLP